MKILLKAALIIIMFVVNLSADEFIIKSFKGDISDLSARTNSMKDVNDEYCAIIKVRTDLNELNFYSNQLEDAEQKDFEYWLYVSPGIRYIEISKSNFIKKGYRIPITIKSQTVYVMELTNKEKLGINAYDNTVQLTFRFNENNVYVFRDKFAPIQTKGKNAVLTLPKGQYNFRFTKNGFNNENKIVSLTNDKIIDVKMIKGSLTSKLKLPGIVTINSYPEGAEIFINNQKAGQTPYTDQLIAGDYQISLRKKLYYTEILSLKLKEGESVTVPTLTLKPRFAYATITTTPEECKIFLDNKLIGNSPINKQKVDSGVHYLRIVKDLYHAEEQSVIFQDGENQEISVELEPAFGELIINSIPEFADVFLDGKHVGKTPYQNSKQPSRTYSIKVSKDLWYSTEKEVIISDGEKTKNTIVLSQNYGTLNVKAENSTIFINNEKSGQNSYSRQLSPGMYNIRATRPKHRDAKQEVFVKISETLNVELKPDPILGSISIISHPINKTMGSKIFIDNKIIPDKTTPAVLPLLIGEYNITLKHIDFLNMTKPISIADGEQKMLVFNMLTYKGSILAKENSWKKRKWLSFGTSAVIFCAGIACNYFGDQSYNDYQIATNTSTADNLQKDSELYYKSRNISYSISVAPMIYGLYSWIKQKHHHRKMIVSKKN